MRRVLGCVLGVFVVLAGVAGPAGAHAVVVGTVPAYGASVDVAPERVTVTFDEGVTAAERAVTVTDRDGVRVDAGEVSTADGGRTVAVRLPPDLPRGTYLLGWVVLSADGHTVSGSSVFGVGVPPDLTLAAPPPDPLRAAVDTVIRLLAALSYLGIAAAVGAPLIARSVWPAGIRAAALGRLVRVGAVTVAVTAVLTFLAVPARLAGAAGWGDPEVWWQAAGSTLGAAALVRAVAAGIIAVVGERLRDVGGGASWGVGGVVVVVSTAVAGHAAAGADRPIAVVSTVIHLTAMAVWIGGLLVALLLRRHPDRAGILTRFGRYAAASIVALAVTGAYQTWRSVTPVQALWTTSWGRLLLLKLVVVFAVLGVAVAVRAAVRRSGDGTRLLRVEVALQVAVVTVTAILVGVTPARDSYDPPVTMVADLGPVRADVSVDGAGAGDQEITVRLRDGSGAAIGAARVSGQLTRADADAGPIDIAFRRVEPVEFGPHYFSAESVRVPLAGQWRLRLTVVVDRTNAYTATVPYRVW
ncbi:copper resistance CopC/CopD family protein [Nocardia bovistercoris]|uniref:Copper resistance protein CopC/CopD n=1 Tax=Nocardia bovistercoris TaxID=2785916 RepID=A0A931IA14_9NOCA|nr:copper resistance protein CopC/CopD [Nocardia bovistercoris]